MYMSVKMLVHTRKWTHTRDIFLYLLLKLIYIGNLSISEHRDLIQLKKNPKISRRKEIIKIKAEINEKEMKEMIAKINKTKSWFFEKIKLINH